MQIIEVNEVANILNQIGIYIALGAILLAIYGIGTSESDSFLVNIAIGMLIVSLILVISDEVFGEKNLQYVATVTQFEEVEKNGYKVVEHKKDDLYILEKIVTEEGK